MADRRYSVADRLIAQVDQGLRTVFGRPPTTGRAHPTAGIAEAELNDEQRRTSARLMRVNHTGEVCAQALYQGQALAARSPRVRDSMRHAAEEENDHLAWCDERIEQLAGRTSRLNPLFYVGSLSLGAIAGAAGDRWSLGFLAETERQVVRHLERYERRLPAEDGRSRAIVEQMKIDEGAHAGMAIAAGGSSLPSPLRGLMKLSSKLMTGTTYWV